MTAKTQGFSKDLSLFVLDDIGLVFSEAAQEIYELNTTATYIWCRLEDGTKPSDMPLALAETFGFTLAEAERHLGDILAEWQDLRFFGNGKAAKKDASGSSNDFPRKRIRQAIKQAISRQLPYELCYRVLGQDIRVGFVSREAKDRVRPTLSHLEVSCEARNSKAVSLSVTQDDKDYVISEPGRTGYRCGRLEEVAPYVIYLVFSRSIDKAGFSIAFHAGAVSDGQHALILPGKAGSGKTSLTTALIHEGYRYHSDDLILLNEGELEIRGVPFSLCIKESGTDLLSTYFPQLTDLVIHKRPDEKRARYLPPPRSAFENGKGQAPYASWVVFPQYMDGADTQLREIGPSAALRTLIKQCALSPPLTHRQVETLVFWLRSVAYFELPMSSLEEAVRKLRGLWEVA